jgi:putative sterol carrier protein
MAKFPTAEWVESLETKLNTDEHSDRKAAFGLRAPYDQFIRVLLGELDPMQAMLTLKLSVAGTMAVMMRNIPTVLDFVRCLGK